MTACLKVANDHDHQHDRDPRGAPHEELAVERLGRHARRTRHDVHLGRLEGDRETDGDTARADRRGGWGRW